jgi:hypothetical protein
MDVAGRYMISTVSPWPACARHVIVDAQDGRCLYQCYVLGAGGCYGCPVMLQHTASPPPHQQQFATGLLLLIGRCTYTVVIVPAGIGRFGASSTMPVRWAPCEYVLSLS